MPRYGVRYGRAGQPDTACQAFDNVVNSDSKAPSMTSSTIRKWGTTTFTSNRVSEADSRKRKVDDGEAGLGDDPFSFDSDEDGSPKKRGAVAVAAAAAAASAKTATQAKKVIITSTTVRKNPLKTVGNNAVTKVIPVPVTRVVPVPVSKVIPVASATNKPVTKTVVIKTVTKPNANKPVTTVQRGNVVITTKKTIIAPQKVVTTNPRPKPPGNSCSNNSQSSSAGSSNTSRRFFTSVLDHNYSHSLDGSQPLTQKLMPADSSSQQSQTLSSSQSSKSDFVPRSSGGSPFTDGSSSVLTQKSSQQLLSSRASQGSQRSDSDFDFDPDEEIESGDPEIIFNSPRKRAAEAARLKNREIAVHSPGVRSTTDSPISISDDDSVSSGSSLTQKNGSQITKTYGRLTAGTKIGTKAGDVKKPMLMTKSLSLDGRLTKPPSLESSKPSMGVRKPAMHSAKSLPTEERFSSKHALSQDSSKPVLISYSRKKKVEDTKEPTAKRLLSGSNKKAAVYNPRQWHSDGTETASSQESTSGGSQPKTATPFDDAFDDDFDGKPVARPPLVRRKTAPNSNQMMDEPDHITKVQITREHKPLYTVVRNVKQAHEVQEHGETQDFEDDLEYIMSGIGCRHSVPTRCLSTISLVTKCMMPSFRMHLRAHSTLTKVFSALNDSPEHPTLALCTAAVLYMLSRDRIAMELEKSILQLMVELLSMDTQNSSDSSEYTRTKYKISSICQKAKDEGLTKHLDIEDISTGALAMESLLSMTSKRAGDWFKEELRKLGGLDHIINTVSECIDDLDEFVVDPSEAMLSRLMKIERCLRVLDNVTYLNKDNQNYLITYNKSQLIQSLCRTLKVCENCLPFNGVEEDAQGNYDKDSAGAVVFRSCLSVLKVLINLTHDSDKGSAEVGNQPGLIRTILMLVLQIPQYVPTKQRFDLLVLSLGVLINMAEHCDKNRQQLLKVKVAGPYELHLKGEDMVALDALVQLFVSRLQAAKKTEEEQEEMKKQRRAEKAAQAAAKVADKEPELFMEHPSQDVSGEWHESDSGLEWVIMPENHGKKSSSSNNGPSAPAISDDDSDSENDLELLAAQGEENEDFTKALHKAGKHMEDSIVCAYISLLVGCLIQNNPDLTDYVRNHLTDGNFEPMVTMLKKFLGFMHLTTATGSTAGKSIRKVIDVLETC